nr:hypothetical protein [Methanophagales archaeon]
MLESLSWLFFLASSFLLGFAVLSVLSIRLAAEETGGLLFHCRKHILRLARIHPRTSA